MEKFSFTNSDIRDAWLFIRTKGSHQKNEVLETESNQTVHAETNLEVEASGKVLASFKKSTLFSDVS